MLFLLSTCKIEGVESPGERLERIIKTAVDSSGGRYSSVRDFIIKAGLSSGGWSNWKNKNKREPEHEISDVMLKSIARELGVSHFELYRRVHPPPPTPGEKFPNRVMAVDMARELGFSEEAIRTVLAENPKVDGSRWYWLKRIEAEEVGATPFPRRESL